jgi:TnpA family transposase
MMVEKNYVDSHGQSTVAFAFCHLLNFQLLPRLKGIHRQKLSRPTAGQPHAYPHLQAILTRPIRWDRIYHQYDTMMQYATALRLGTADAQTILKRFTRSNYQHPTYRALVELGKAVKTVFLCRFLHDEALRQEIHDGLQVIETWNSANDFIFYGRGGDSATNRLEDQEIAMLALHLLQISLVSINPLMVQQMNWLRVLQIGLNSCSIEENLIQSDASTYLHTRPGNHDYTGKKPSNHAHSRPTLRNRVQHIYLPAPLDAQTWSKVQTWLSLPL